MALNCGKEQFDETPGRQGGNSTINTGIESSRTAAGPGGSSNVREKWFWDGDLIGDFQFGTSDPNWGTTDRPLRRDPIKKGGKVYEYGSQQSGSSGGTSSGRFLFAIKECTEDGSGDGGGGGGGGGTPAPPSAGCEKPHWAIFEEYTQINEGSYYEGLISRSSDSGAEHQIVYVNETKSPNEIIQFPKMTMMGLSLRATREFNNLDQPRVYLKEGTSVSKLTGGTGASNNYADLVYYLLTNDRAGVGEVVTNDMVDKDRMTITAKFIEKMGIGWDGTISEKTNMRSFASQTAPFYLCNFTITNGKFTLWPVIPVDNNGNFKDQPAYIKQIFTEGNIIDGSFSLDYLDADDRRPFKASMRYRVMYENQLPEERTLTTRWYTGSFSDPTEDFDMTQFCTTPEHALLAARYFLWIRNVVTHTVKFQTVPEVMNGVGPGDFIKVRMESGALRRLNVGAITTEGTITSSDSWADGSYEVNYWVPGMSEPAQATVTLVNGEVQESGYEGALISVVPALDDCDPSENCYQIEAVNLEDDGLVGVTASYYPLDSRGHSDLYNALFGLGRWSRGVLCQEDQEFSYPCDPPCPDPEPAPTTICPDDYVAWRATITFGPDLNSGGSGGATSVGMGSTNMDNVPFIDNWTPGWDPISGNRHYWVVNHTRTRDRSMLGASWLVWQAGYYNRPNDTTNYVATIYYTGDTPLNTDGMQLYITGSITLYPTLQDYLDNTNGVFWSGNSYPSPNIASDGGYTLSAECAPVPPPASETPEAPLSDDEDEGFTVGPFSIGDPDDNTGETYDNLVTINIRLAYRDLNPGSYHCDNNNPHYTGTRFADVSYDLLTPSPISSTIRGRGVRVVYLDRYSKTIKVTCGDGNSDYSDKEMGRIEILDFTPQMRNAQGIWVDDVDAMVPGWSAPSFIYGPVTTYGYSNGTVYSDIWSRRSYYIDFIVIAGQTISIPSDLAKPSDWGYTQYDIRLSDENLYAHKQLMS